VGLTRRIPGPERIVPIPRAARPACPFAGCNATLSVHPAPARIVPIPRAARPACPFAGCNATLSVHPAPARSA